jgi:hypothetical protein
MLLYPFGIMGMERLKFVEIRFVKARLVPGLER